MSSRSTLLSTPTFVPCFGQRLDVPTLLSSERVILHVDRVIIALELVPRGLPTSGAAAHGSSAVSVASEALLEQVLLFNSLAPVHLVDLSL